MACSTVAPRSRGTLVRDVVSSDVNERLKYLITEASQYLQHAIYYLSLGPKKARERTRAYEDTLSRCQQAKDLAEQGTKAANNNLQSHLADVKKVTDQIASVSGETAALGHKIAGYEESIARNQSEIEQADRSYRELEDNINSQKRKVRKRKKKAGLFGALAIVAAPIAPILVPAAFAGAAAGEMMSIDDARRKLGDLRNLRDVKQNTITQLRTQKEEASREKERKTQEKSAKESELSSLEKKESQLKKAIKDLGDVSESLMKLTTHLSTLHGKAKVVTMESKLVEKYPLASTKGLVASTGVLASEMYKVNAHLSLDSVNKNTITEEKYAYILLGNIESLSNSLS